MIVLCKYYIMRLFDRKAFSLIEIMIVVAIIAIAISIAVPNFFKMNEISKRTVCINNLKKITAAVEEWALEKNITSGTEINESREEDIYTNYFRGGRPKCPTAGEYVIYPVGANPQVRCTEEDKGHIL